jgi:hypothetical protein
VLSRTSTWPSCRNSASSRPRALTRDRSACPVSSRTTTIFWPSGPYACGTLPFQGLLVDFRGHTAGVGVGTASVKMSEAAMLPTPVWWLGPARECHLLGRGRSCFGPRVGRGPWYAAIIRQALHLRQASFILRGDGIQAKGAYDGRDQKSNERSWQARGAGPRGEPLSPTPQGNCQEGRKGSLGEGEGPARG